MRSETERLREDRWTNWPYSIQRTRSGGYVVLNRRYKPLGISSADWVEYDDWAIELELSGDVARELSVCGSDSVDRIWLYNDGSVPTRTKDAMAAYQRRLLILSSIGGPIVQVGQAPAPAGPQSSRGEGVPKSSGLSERERRRGLNSTQKPKSGGTSRDQACQE